MAALRGCYVTVFRRVLRWVYAKAWEAEANIGRPSDERARHKLAEHIAQREELALEAANLHEAEDRLALLGMRRGNACWSSA